jgi:hypothetical protein
LVRARGRPVAEADVQLGGPGGSRSTKSGPDGAFSFRELPEGRYALRATHEHEAGFLEMVSVGVDEPDGGAGVLVVELKPAARVVGRLLEKSGRSIPGGEVLLMEGAAVGLERKVPTASDGSFRIEAVLPGTYVISGRADGFFASEPRSLEVPPLKAGAPPGKIPETSVDLRLERGAVIEGSVVDDGGRAVVGAHVEVSGEGPDGAPIAVTAAGGLGGDSLARVELSGELGILRGPIPYPPLVPAPRDAPSQAGAKGFVTDAKGGFRLIGLPAGKLVVAAVHPDYARGTSEPVMVAPGATVSVRVVLTHGESVRGRVVGDAGEPLVGVELSGDGRTLAVSDAHGEFELTHVAHAITLTARLAGHLPATRAVKPGEPDPIELTLARAEGRLAGVVVDDRGVPVAGARIELTAGALAAIKTASDKSGGFRLEALGPAPYRVRVTHPDFAPASLDGLPAGDDARIELHPGGGIAGEVRDARTGALPPGARLEVLEGGRPRAIPIVKGRFEVTGLGPGRQILQLSAPGYVTLSRDVDVPAADRPREPTVRDLVLELERGGSIVGHVRDENGDPLVGADVICGALRARTDARGDYRLDGVPPGRATVRVESNGRHASDDTDLRPNDESRLDLHLR